MTYRTIKQITGQGQYWAKVQWSAEFEEFKVKFYHHAAWMTEADYFTTDKHDAVMTAEHELTRLNKGA